MTAAPRPAVEEIVPGQPSGLPGGPAHPLEFRGRPGALWARREGQAHAGGRPGAGRASSAPGAASPDRVGVGVDLPDALGCQPHAAQGRLGRSVRSNRSLNCLRFWPSPLRPMPSSICAVLAMLSLIRRDATQLGGDARSPPATSPQVN